jgi:uncharacterized protein (TIGR01777 family)
MGDSKKILITGASGLIGSVLTDVLVQRGHQVSHLGRQTKSGKIKSFVWNVANRTIDEHAFDNIDTIIHLAGANVSEKRWTEKRKKEILESRTLSTKLLIDTLRQRKHNVTSFVAASAIGYYGFDRDEVFTESTSPGNDFLADVVKKWEYEEDQASTLSIRTVNIRIGIVLSDKGGALVEMAKPARWFVAAPLGDGKQYVSWIHIRDLANIFVEAVENRSLHGPYNAAAPNPVTNRELTRIIADELHRPMFLPPVPTFALRMFLGEMADIVVTGSKVSPEKILHAGFTFEFTNARAAVHDLLGR